MRWRSARCDSRPPCGAGGSCASRTAAVIDLIERTYSTLMCSAFTTSTHLVGTARATTPKTRPSLLQRRAGELGDLALSRCLGPQIGVVLLRRVVADRRHPKLAHALLEQIGLRHRI